MTVTLPWPLWTFIAFEEYRDRDLFLLYCVHLPSLAKRSQGSLNLMLVGALACVNMHWHVQNVCFTWQEDLKRGAQKIVLSFSSLFLLSHFVISHGNWVQYVCLVKGLVAMNECTFGDGKVIRRFTNQNIVVVRPYVMESVSSSTIVLWCNFDHCEGSEKC